VHPLQWLGRRDPDLAALRRAGRAAIVMPAMFALGQEVIGDPNVATFAAFGSFAMLLLVDFGGPLRESLQDQLALALVGSAFVCLGTLASHSVWLSTLAMTIVGFGVIFAGVVSSVLAVSLHPASDDCRAGFLDSQSGNQLGHSGGSCAAGGRTAVAGAGARSAARGGHGGLSRVGREAAHGDRLPDERQRRHERQGRHVCARAR